jgi:predicted ATP-grasp superfamily ATP-dependent carboligase
VTKPVAFVRATIAIPEVTRSDCPAWRSRTPTQGTAAQDIPAMRILVHEFASGGGMAGREVPASLGREGAAMLTALLADLAAIPGYEIVTTRDVRFRFAAPRSVEVATISAESDRKIVDRLIASAEAVWLIAPETGRCLERLAARVEKKKKKLIGSSASAIRRAADKSSLPRLLGAHDVSHPPTRALPDSSNWAAAKQAADRLGYPVVVKPARGAGCEGVWLARDAGELRAGIRAVRMTVGRERLLIQRYVKGVAASVSLLADGRRAVALTLNHQWVRGSKPFSYHGGVTPFEHPLAGRAIEAACRACQAVTGLRGYVGVDLVLTESEAVVLEINPRLTTAYLGVRSVVDGNIAAMAIAACAGTLPDAPLMRASVHFTAAGRVHS